METGSGFKSFSIVELMGHTTLAGMVSEEEIAGHKMLRIDVPEVDEQPAHTRFFGTQAIYSLTPVTEDVVAAVLRRNGSKPVFAYGLPRQLAPAAETETETDHEEAIEGEQEETPMW